MWGRDFPVIFGLVWGCCDKEDGMGGNSRMETRRHGRKIARKNRRRKKLERGRNVRRSSVSPRFVLNVEVIDGNGKVIWKPVMTFRKRKEVDVYVESVEEMRVAGNRIVMGQIIHLRSGRIVKVIEPSGYEGPLDHKSGVSVND